MSANETNGTGGFVRPLLDLGDLTPEKQAIATVLRDGQPVTLWGWVDGRRCPGYVKSAVAAHRRTYRDAVYQPGEPDELGQHVEVFTHSPLAYDDYKRDVLLAVIEGLEYTEAAVLAGNDDTAMTVLRRLRWVEDEEEATDSPEAEGAPATPPTTPDSSPTSLPSASRRTRR
jgi:hypothetical protein